jgi:hypothetical protein
MYNLLLIAPATNNVLGQCSRYINSELVSWIDEQDYFGPPHRIAKVKEMYDSLFVIWSFIYSIIIANLNLLFPFLNN